MVNGKHERASRSQEFEMAKRTSPEMLPVPTGDAFSAAERVADAVLEYLGTVPESVQKKSPAPAEQARKLTIRAAAKAAGAAGTLALPLGPAGWLTILPEMIAVWKIQAQLVADIAALHGKKANLTEEQMLYCLFKHTASQAFRDIVVRVGERVLVKRASFRVIQKLASAIGVKVTQRVVAKGVTRWVPIIGALGVGAYAYYDTAQVAKAALELFSREIEVDDPPEADQ